MGAAELACLKALVDEGPGWFAGRKVSQLGHWSDTATEEDSSSRHCLYQEEAQLR